MGRFWVRGGFGWVLSWVRFGEFFRVAEGCRFGKYFGLKEMGDGCSFLNLGSFGKFRLWGDRGGCVGESGCWRRWGRDVERGQQRLIGFSVKEGFLAGPGGRGLRG